MDRYSATGLDFRLIPPEFNALLEFLTGFTAKKDKGDILTKVERVWYSNPYSSIW